MSNSEKQTASGGVGFFGLLGIVFIVLKLCGVIDWPWIWVLVPIWGSIALAVLIFVAIVVAAFWAERD